MGHRVECVRYNNINITRTVIIIIKVLFNNINNHIMITKRYILKRIFCNYFVLPATVSRII